MTTSLLLAALIALGIGIGAFTYAVRAAAKLPKKPKRDAAPQPEVRPKTFAYTTTGTINFADKRVD
jgi:hypothetical protein